MKENTKEGATENARNDIARPSKLQGLTTRDRVTGADNARTFWIDGRDKFSIQFASVFPSDLLIVI